MAGKETNARTHAAWLANALAVGRGEIGKAQVLEKKSIQKNNHFTVEVFG